MILPVNEGNNTTSINRVVTEQLKQITKPPAWQRKAYEVLGWFVWTIKNARQGKAISRYLFKSPKFQSELLLGKIGKKVVEKTKKLLKLNASMAGIRIEIVGRDNLPQHTSLFIGKVKMSPKMRDLFIRVARWLRIDLKPTALLAKAINDDFSSGVCHGMCQAFIGQLKKKEEMSITELQNNKGIESDTAKLQGLHFLEVNIHNTGHYRCKILEKLKENGHMTPQQACYELGFAKFAADLDKNRDGAIKQLKDLIYEGAGLLTEVQEEIETIVGGKEKIKEFDFTDTKAWETKVSNMQNILMNESYRKPTLFSMSPKDGRGAHTVLADPASNRLFDPNRGWYQYNTRQEMVTALLDMLVTSYPCYGGTVEFITYD